jgi:hypothetical protein
VTVTSTGATRRLSRLASAFADVRASGRAGLVTYVTAGDPDLEHSRQVLLALARAGADVLEVGVPFSEPLADGPVIQRATERALAAGATLGGVLELVASVRSELAAPIVLFTYVNPLVRMGIPEFAMRAAAAGVDGVLTLDLPLEEAGDVRNRLHEAGLDTIFLLSPTTTTERIRRAAALDGPRPSAAGSCTASRAWASPGRGRPSPQAPKPWSPASVRKRRCRWPSASVSRGRSTCPRWPGGRTPPLSEAPWSASSPITAPRRRSFPPSKPISGG